MINDNREDFGPSIESGARRDPALSIHRNEPRQPRTPRREIPTGWVGDALLAIACILSIPAILILLGILLHGTWTAIMVGWQAI